MHIKGINTFRPKTFVNRKIPRVPTLSSMTVLSVDTCMLHGCSQHREWIDSSLLKSSLSVTCLFIKMRWMCSIDFLINHSLLNNQATANALVITIQPVGHSLYRQTFLHVLQGFLIAVYTLSVWSVRWRREGKIRIIQSIFLNAPLYESFSVIDASSCFVWEARGCFGIRT